MDRKVLNTTYDFTFANGTTVELTLAFYKLYQLRSKNKKLYDRYNKIMTSQANGSYDELDTCTLLYIAYLCANEGDDLLTEEEFYMLCGSDRDAIGEAIKHLVTPKKA
jgi:hypothetical protein